MNLILVKDDTDTCNYPTADDMEEPTADMINELFGESFNDSYMFEGFSDVEENDTEQQPGENPQTEEDHKLERLYEKHYATIDKLDPENPTSRERLPKVENKKEFGKLKQSVERILSRKLNQIEKLCHLVDVVYAMGMASAEFLGIKLSKNTNRSRTKNRQEMKTEKKVRELRTLIARTSNELHRRKTRRKATKKEKEILSELKLQLQEESSCEALRRKKEEWLEELRHLLVKNKINTNRRKRFQNNRIYRQDQRKLFVDKKEMTGETPKMEEFVEFWGKIWEENEETPNRKWMDTIGQKIRNKITTVKEFKITEKDLKDMIWKRKNWSAPGIDGIQNFWWKQFETARKKAVEIMKTYIEQPDKIPVWLPRGRTIMIAKTERRDSVKEQRPITCLNTIYKCLSGMLAKHKMDHAVENQIWDEQQFGATKNVLGTTDHLLVDQSIMEEVKDKHRNLVAYYDYQKA